MARQLGIVIMARAAADCRSLKLESYDRFFPNQDFLPKGGFGNLIALPLQRIPRNQGNSVFVDAHYVPFPNQWEYLAGVRRLSYNKLRAILTDNAPQAVSFPSLVLSATELQPAERDLDAVIEHVAGCLQGEIALDLGAAVAIDLHALPARLLNALKRTATFANPKFFELQKRRFSTWNTPRYVSCAEKINNKLVLPRGTLEACVALVEKAGGHAVIRDQRCAGEAITARFTGKLIGPQRAAVREMLRYETGVLVAPPGAGKTIMACAIIAARRVNTLVLVHRKQLLEQWEKQAQNWLTISSEKKKSVRRKRYPWTGKLDIMMLPTLARRDGWSESMNIYGQVIIDECHHIPAVSFEKVLKNISAKHVLGLTATPFRKDGHQIIIHFQCGPTRQVVKNASTALQKTVHIHETALSVPVPAGGQAPLHEIWDALIADPLRNQAIITAIIKALEAGRFPLILSDRKEHLVILYDMLEKYDQDKQWSGFVLSGQMGKKVRRATMDGMRTALAAGRRAYLFSTGSLIGEGFDLPELCTLVLAMPISFKGRLIQYAGRIEREHPGKRDVQIHDFVDVHVPVAISMFRKRLPAYRKMGYAVEYPLESVLSRKRITIQTQQELFVKIKTAGEEKGN
jgi:superfamily II DNA or RNA helicase